MKHPLDQHVLLTQRFLPEHGGSIRWMFEAYKRWPWPVRVITHDYYNHPPRTPEFPHVPTRPAQGDHAASPNFTLDRRDIFLRDWGLENPRRAWRYLRMTRAVAQCMSRVPKPGRLIVHCVHAVPEVASLLPLKWRWGSRLKIVCYAHGEEITACNSSRQLRYIMKKAQGIVDLMLANSDYTAGMLHEMMDPGKVRVVHPGVELAEFSEAPSLGARWRAEQGYADKLVVLTLGRLDPRKNHAALIEAAARLQGRHPRLLYLAAGQGRTMEQLKALARERGVEERVKLVGSVDGSTRLALFGGCDIFAMPAIRDGTDVEGFGMVFLEAAACGKPSLAGQEGGQRDAVIDGQTGLIVDGTDLDQVTQALDKLLSQADLRQRLGRQGREYAQAFDWPMVVEKTRQLVEEL